MLIDLGGLDGLLAVDAERGRVTLGAGTNLYQLPALLEPHGLALENMGDIDRQTIAGATSTGTHGTGARFGGLATQITGVVLVTADGSLLRVDEQNSPELLPAVRLGLGALGVLVEVTIQCVPTFLLHAVEHPEPFGEVLDTFEERATASDHFEFYWWPHTDAVMTKTNTRLPGDARAASDRSGLGLDRGPPALQRRALAHVQRRTDRAEADPGHQPARDARLRRPRVHRPSRTRCSRARARRASARWSTRCRVAAVPQALRDVRGLIEREGWTISFPIEVRVAAADDNWLSTAQGRESGYIAVHRYFREDHLPYFRAVDAIMRELRGPPALGQDPLPGRREPRRRTTRTTPTSSRCATASTPTAPSRTRTWIECWARSSIPRDARLLDRVSSVRNAARRAAARGEWRSG